MMREPAAHRPEHRALQSIFIGDKLHNGHQRIEGKHQRNPKQHNARRRHARPAGQTIEQQGGQERKRKAFAGINPLSGTPGIPMPRTIASAAPKAAADETPSVNGLARELFRIVCISAPAKPSAIPTERHQRIGQTDVPNDNPHAVSRPGRMHQSLYQRM